MSGNKKIAVLAAAGAAVLCVALRFLGGIPAWVTWEQGLFYDSMGNYEIRLDSKVVTVRNDNGVIWTSPEGVRVQKALSCDIDNDRSDELVLLCWRRGRFGKYRPFWVEKNEQGWSQHLLVCEYDGGKDGGVSHKWMSSYIGQDVADITSNGKAAPNLRLWFCSPDGEMSSWVWDSWGFKREKSDINFSVFGDLLAHEPIYRYGLEKDMSFGFLFENVRDIINKSDVAVINQETPLVDRPELYGDYPRFGTPDGVGQAIADAGFDVVTCATDHALDRGEYGVDFTRNFFDRNYIVCLGIQPSDSKEEKPYRLIQRNGVTFALFNYTYGTNGMRPPGDNPGIVSLFPGKDKAKSDIAAAKGEADFVVVLAHWGTEYAREPDDFQREWTQVFLDSGVDIVVGTHPHALQPYEMLTGGSGQKMLVYYSIGNFISAQREQGCIKGGIARFTVSLAREGYRITKYSLEPLAIRHYEDGKYSAEMLKIKEWR